MLSTLQADRLFEMGFAEQIMRISMEVPDTKQTLVLCCHVEKIVCIYVNT
jgi:superfamily II DNA/RNA helicase